MKPGKVWYEVTGRSTKFIQLVERRGGSSDLREVNEDEIPVLALDLCDVLTRGKEEEVNQCPGEKDTNDSISVSPLSEDKPGTYTVREKVESGCRVRQREDVVRDDTNGHN